MKILKLIQSSIGVGDIVGVLDLEGKWRVLFITKETDQGKCTLKQVDGQCVRARNISSLTKVS